MECTTMASEGRTIGNRYKIVKRLGQGAQGVTYTLETLRGDDDNNNNAADIKVGKALRVSLLTEAAREAEILHLMSNRNVVSFVEHFIELTMLWLIMEYCEGGDLAMLITKRKKENDPFDKAEIINMFVQIMQGVSYIHDMRIVHRDIKPSNIFISGGTMKLGDFGIARQFSPGAQMSTIIGTVLYMSPEVMNNNGYTEATDLWSCGCVLYEMCCLESPFQGKNLFEITTAVTRGNKPSMGDRYGGAFQEPYESLVCIDQDQRMSAAVFLQTFFTESQETTRTVLLVGMTGVGKSSFGNLLAGSDVFKTSDGMRGCTSRHCVHRSNETGITIIDTMGLADPDLTDGQIRGKITEALDATRDGVDIIFFVIDFHRMTNERYAVFTTLLMTFGEECKKHLVLVITKSPTKYVFGKPDELLIEQNKWLEKCLNEGGKSAEMFREVSGACQSVLFIDNQPPNEIEELEEKFQEIREHCRENVLKFVRENDYGKYTCEAALRAREQQRQKDEELQRYQNLMRQQQENMQTLRDDKEELKQQLEHQGQLIKEREAYKKRKESRLYYHDMYCVRKKCRAFKAILNENSSQEDGTVDLRQLWRSHRESCPTCLKCLFCSEDAKLDLAFDDDTTMMEAIKNNRLVNFKAMEQRISKLSQAEQAKYRKNCVIS